jgi:PhnB protein
MRASFHLTFAGRCEDAFKFYERVVDAKIDFLQRYGDSPADGRIPLDWRDKVVHASLTIGDAQLAGVDLPPGEFEPPQGFYVLLSIGDAATAARVFEALAEGGTIRMPLQKTFWSIAFGVLIDQFGIPWEISCTQRVSS